MSEHTGPVSNDASFVGFDHSTETYYAEHEWGGPDPIVDTVVRSVAAVTGADPTEMAPLYDVVDPDALNRLFHPPGTVFQNGDGRIELAYAGCDVTIHRDGHLAIRPPSTSPARP